jgi:hypothetical protein
VRAGKENVEMMDGWREGNRATLAGRLEGSCTALGGLGHGCLSVTPTVQHPAAPIEKISHSTLSWV